MANIQEVIHLVLDDPEDAEDVPLDIRFVDDDLLADAARLGALRMTPGRVSQITKASRLQRSDVAAAG
jgi:hypothetical protein